ncbi:hypothetical protein VOLCADRAFT_97073 [Volvox carteri f. nagariensis]|uniref:Uncharacterized protein n=1 Tax=Volvox carteri f. nagariensis TaxID=3068 RepID=D8UBU0_VOLCA|nr:uncharacterized protein VOLCADRAFT_97073 [Volvox carteri f. nagariensis]EFJ42825.1 hypothetical protein VOLCADRAFT_97073 [Volvox carteri f. nagariensis]|eukprot:XP_002956085.1 hypothetical protein VOLCADRAFT_97073 [Volvox carteri f. nagariensis]
MTSETSQILGHKATDEAWGGEVLGAHAAVLRVQQLRQAFREGRANAAAQAAGSMPRTGMSPQLHPTRPRQVPPPNPWRTAAPSQAAQEIILTASNWVPAVQAEKTVGDGILARGAPAPVESLRQQWREQQRRHRMISRTEQQQQQQSKQTVPDGGWHGTSSQSTSWDANLQRAIWGFKRSPRAATATASVAAPSHPLSTVTLYGYAERTPFGTPPPPSSAPYTSGAASGAADAASTTAAAVAAAAANLSTLLSTASSAFNTRHHGTAPAGRQQSSPPRPPSRKPIYAPDPDPALTNRLPLFRNTTNIPPPQPRPQRRSRAADAAAMHRPERARGNGSAAANNVVGPFTSGVCAANPAAVATTTDSMEGAGGGGGSILDRDGAAAAGPAAGSAPATLQQKVRTAGWRRTSGGIGGRDQATAGASAVSAAAAGSNGAWAGRLLYDMAEQADVHLPDMGSIRPRAAMAVMGRSKRGLDEHSLPLDERAPLEVRNTLRKRAPSASFAAQPYRPYSTAADRVLAAATLASTRGSTGSGFGADWKQHREPAAPLTDSPEKGPLSGRLSDRRSLPRGGRAHQDQEQHQHQLQHQGVSGSGPGGLGDGLGAARAGTETGFGAAGSQTTAEPFRAAPCVVFSRAARFAQPGYGAAAAVAAAAAAAAATTGRGAGGDAAQGASDMPAERQELGELSRKRWSTTWGDATATTTTAAGGGGVGGFTEGGGVESGRGPVAAVTTAAAATAVSSSMAPLKLDAAYRAVLPRVSCAVISATSRRLDWLPSPAAATATAAATAFASASQQPEQRQSRSGRSPSLLSRSLTAPRHDGQARRSLSAPSKMRRVDRERLGKRQKLIQASRQAGDGADADIASRTCEPQQPSRPHSIGRGQHRSRRLHRSASAGRGPSTISPAVKVAAAKDEADSESAGQSECMEDPGTDPAAAGGRQSSGDNRETVLDEEPWSRRRLCRRRHQKHPLEPMAPLEKLAHAVAAVRPRVPVARFATRSVAADMRRELQERRHRQLQKARQLEEQLRNQTVDQLWPAVAAAQRRERLQALARRRLDPGPGPGPGPGGEGSDGGGHNNSSNSCAASGGDDNNASQAGQQQRQEGQRAGAESLYVRDAASPPLAREPGADQGAVSTDTHPGLFEGDVRRVASPSVAARRSPRSPSASSTSRARVDLDSKTPSPPPSPPAPPPPSTTAVSTPRWSGITVRVAFPVTFSSPERPLPHFLAATRRTLSNLLALASPHPAAEAATTATAAEAAALAPPLPPSTQSEPTGDRSGKQEPHPLAQVQVHQQVVYKGTAAAAAAGPDPWVAVPGTTLTPSYTLVEKRAPAVSFSPVRQRPHSQPRYSRDPGPGHYDPGVADGAISRLARSPAAVFGTARRSAADPYDSPTRRDGAAAAPTPSVQISDDNGRLLERIPGPSDPWFIDLAIRPRRPAWGFSALGHEQPAQRPVGRYLLDLRPVYDLVQRRVMGVPDFTHTPERTAGEAARLKKLRRQPGIGEYDVEMAWSYLCRRAPQVLMHLAAPRWRDEAAGPREPGEGDDGSPRDDVEGGDGDAAVRQRRQALLELSQALDYIRPRPPAWTFAPVVRAVRRDVGSDDPRVRGVGFGPLLSWDVDLTLVRRRLPGALPFGAGPSRRQGLTLLDSRALAAVRHLGPGFYEAELAWRAVQPLPRAADFGLSPGHVLGIGELPQPDDGGELPYGTRLTLDAAAAKDATLRRRDRGAAAVMALALGREEALPVDPAYDHRTAHLPLPDPNLDLPTRPRVRNVVLEGGPGHQPLAPEPSTHGMLRGPGAYFPADAEQALAVVGATARVVDFGRGPERRGLLVGPGSTSPEKVLEGNRLVLSPHTALDYVRPRPPAALIQPPHDDAAPYDLPYLHAVYDVQPGFGLLLRRAPGQPNFGTQPGRDPPLAWPAGIDPAAPLYGRAVGWLGPEDIALTQLAGFRRAPGAPDFTRMLSRTSPGGKVDYDGQRLLDLDPYSARDRLRWQPPRPPNLALGRGHGDPTAVEGPDRDLTAWLNYRPRWEVVRRNLVAQLAVPLSRQIGREQALKGDPRVGDNATGDLDGGVYRTRYRLVWRSAPAIDFGRGAGPGLRTGLAPGALPTDPDAGNVLMLEPRLPTGWRPPRHSAASPTRQPFGRGEGRWERPGADPAYRFLSAVGDEGPALYLRFSADDLAVLRRRATAANAPAAPWGWMTSQRDAQVMQPGPGRPPRRRLPSPAASRIATQLVQQLPPPNSELEILKNQPPSDPRVG